MCIYPSNEIYLKLNDDRDTIDSSLFIFGKIDSLHYALNFDTMIVTFQKKKWTMDLIMTPTMMSIKLLAFIAPES